MKLEHFYYSQDYFLSSIIKDNPISTGCDEMGIYFYILDSLNVDKNIIGKSAEYESGRLLHLPYNKTIFFL